MLFDATEQGPDFADHGAESAYQGDNRGENQASIHRVRINDSYE
jgi:hypothetical protein